MEKLNKKIVKITAAFLFPIGAILGWLIMTGVFSVNPDIVGDGLKLVYKISCAVMVGLLLLLSTKPIIYLVNAIGRFFKNLILNHKPIAVIGGLIGVLLGLMIGYLANALMSLFINIFSLRLILTFVIAALAIYLAGLACSKWLLDNSVVVENDEIRYDNGFIICGKALAEERLIKLFLNGWLTGSAFVLNCTVNKLIEGLGDAGSEQTSKKALEGYKKLVDSEKIKLAEYGDFSDEWQQIIAYSEQKKLKIIVENADKYLVDGKTVNLLNLNDL